MNDAGILQYSFDIALVTPEGVGLMGEIIRAVKEWQELIGAVLGGMFALLVAWYVARDARSREMRAAGMVVIGGLLRFREAYRTANEQIQEKERPEDQGAMILAGLFSVQPPRLAPSVLDSMQRLFLVHTHLAAHLSLIVHVYADVEHALNRWVIDQERFARSPDAGKPAAERQLPREEGDMLGDAKTIRRGAIAISLHSTCAIWMIESLVLSPVSLWFRLRLALAPHQVDRICAGALEKGQFERDPLDLIKRP